MEQNDAIVYLATHKAVVGGRLMEAARTITEIAVSVLKVDRCGVWLFEDDNRVLKCLDVYEAATQEHGCDLDLTAQQYPTYFWALNNARSLAASDAQNDARTIEMRESYLEPLQITSLLDAGIRRAGVMVGVVCLEQRFSIREWAENDVSFAGSLADHMAMALTHSELYQSWDRVAASERQLRHILENVPELFLTVDRNGIITFANRGFAGLSSQDVVGTVAVDWQKPCMQTRFKGVLADAFDGRVGTIESLGWSLASDWRMYKNRMVPIKNGSELDAVQIIAEEITGARRVENIMLAAANETMGLTGIPFLQATVRRLATATEASYALLAILNEEQTSLRTLVLWKEGEFLPNISGDLAGTPSEVVIRSSNCCYPCDLQRTFPDAKLLVKFDVQAYAGVRVWDSHGNIQGLIGVYFKHPISNPQLVESTLAMFAPNVSAEIERLRFEDALAASEKRYKAQYEEAQRANRVKDEFISTLSHELRTPMTAILGWSEILCGADANAEDVKAGLPVIRRNALAEVKLINNLLDLSSILTGNLNLSFTPIKPVELLKSVVSDHQTLAGTRSVTLSLDVTCEDDLIIAADQDRLRQVMEKLLDNAFKFTPRGGAISVRLTRTEDELILSVADSGEGIEPWFLPHIFDYFRLEDASHTRCHGGLGIGLTIARALVRAHRGSMEAHSPGKGKGSTFVVRLPLPETSSP